MKMLINQKTFESLKAKGKVPLECKHCHKLFYKVKNEVLTVLKNNRLNTGTYKRADFCSLSCVRSFGRVVSTECTNCLKQIVRTTSSIKKVKNVFCSKSCAATYNNRHKKYGTRRSKLEKWIEEKLTKFYPNIEIHFNKKDAINSELDIYIPSLKLAFELNGIYHYEPIHGEKKLSSIKANDQCKFKSCIEKGIELCVIDVSSLLYFKEKKANEFLDIILSIISSKMTEQQS